MKGEKAMEFFTVKERDKILSLIIHLISDGLEIAVEIHEVDEKFSTKVMAINEEEGSEVTRLIVEKLYPKEGNSLIQALPELVFSSEVKGRSCVFATRYVGIHTEHPHYGLLVEFPATVRVEDKRKEERLSSGFEKLLSVEFTLEGDEKLYQLKVINIGSSGIGFIVEKENFDLFEKVNVGDQIRDIRFFLPIATLTLDAVVKHMTLIKEGEFEGKYLVGIESGALMELKEIEEEIEKMK
jgi:hypothetical protein